MIRALLALVLALSLLACGGPAKPRHPRVAPNAVVGDCVDPRRAGVVSATPRLKDASRDLNQDGRPERVLADETLCHGGNCYWNLFEVKEGCQRYIGTIAGSALEVSEERSEQGFAVVRGWWRLAGGSRQLVQSYRYRGGGYQLIDVLLCRQGDDDRLLCATEDAAGH